MDQHTVKKRRLAQAASSEVDDNAEITYSDADEHNTTDFVQRPAPFKAECSHPKLQSLHLGPKKSQSAGSASSTNMFKLQVNELAARLPHEHERKATKIEAALRKLRSIIGKIPAQEAMPVPEAELRLKKLYNVRIPFPQPRPGKSTKYSLAYGTPTDITVVGSYSRQTAIRAGEALSIDLAVTMPASMFQDKDYLDYRYFYKRAYYIACLACAIQNAEDCGFTVKYAYQNDNHLQPVLLINQVTPSVKDDSASSRWQIKILLAADPDLFPISKILPNKASIRTKNTEKPSPTEMPATPFYNATLRSECCTSSYTKLLRGVITYSEAFKDACILGNVWLRQRGFGTGVRMGGFGPFEWACLLALLMHGGGPTGKPHLSKEYSSIQLFKAILQFLSTRDLTKNPLLLHATRYKIAKVSEPTIFDGSRGINLLFKMTAWSYQMLRHEASVGMQVMNAALSHSFESMYIKRVNEPLQRFDSVITLHVPESFTFLERMDALDGESRFCQHIYDNLIKGLSDRASLVFPWCSEHNSWPVASKVPSKGKFYTFNIGLILNAAQAYRLVDHGPPTENKVAAAQYRRFWGGKAELRRFRDGSLLETLIWTQNPNETVIEQIARYVIQRHCGQEAAQSLRVVGDGFQRLISDPGPADPRSPFMSAFERLEKDIRGLEGLPMQIRQITAAGPDLRYASLRDASSRGTTSEPRGRKFADVCVQFEGSARWPNDFTAVQRTKIAFLLKIGELLEQSSTEGLIAKVGLENEDTKFLNIAFLDINYPQDVAFRLRIHHERELGLLEEASKDETTELGKREDIAFATATYKRNFIQGPLHTQAVRTLCTRFPLLSPAMRLMKKWRNSHLLSRHISDELIELLTIHIFVTPYPWQAPGSLATAFLRTLTFVSKWEWQTEPLIVDFSGSMGSEDIDRIKLRFEAWRKIDPAMNRVVLFAASNLDPDGITWTEPGPARVIASRFTSLGRAACNLAKAQGLILQPESLFAPSTADYDFLLHLKPRLRRSSHESEHKKPGFKNLQTQTAGGFSDPHPDLVNIYIEELRSLFGDKVLFFHNVLGGSIIGGTWNPQTGPRRWKVNVGYSTTPLVDKEQENIAMNQHGTLKDIARLGGDLVSEVEVK